MLTRFAPSPTGHLHIGNIRTALICWMYARNKKGKFILRFDDTDICRSDIKYIDSIVQDLRWMGINWDFNFRQSERFERYNEIFLQLVKDGYIYACYETREELDIKRKLQLKCGLPPIYDRSALFLTEQEKILYKKEGRKPHFRFKLNRNEIISWNDEIKGIINIAMNHISDPIVKREDGIYTYMLPSVIDDIDFNITHVVRGEDHITNTAIQIQIIRALKAKIYTFAHLPLLYFNNDKKMSKRKIGLNIRSIKEDEIEPITLITYLSNLGTSDPIKSYNIQFLIDSFDIEKFGSAPIKFNFTEIYKLNSKILRQMSFAMMKERLNRIGVNSPEFWYFIRSNIKRFSETVKWWKICKYNNIVVKPIILDKELVKIALDALHYGDFNENTLLEWVKNIQQKVDIKIKDLFMQLRLVLTGVKTGPELAKLLVFIGRENTIERLKKVSTI
ncbi:MAG: glutamate--tRNA ligase [Wolbachia endosymbiont of Menacanthus eurysternus]|nr:MAG: glutamate--tRNA ligase [Wolbachia endosymbiont of Menacanthus eurysternus]